MMLLTAPHILISKCPRRGTASCCLRTARSAAIDCMTDTRSSLSLQIEIAIPIVEAAL